MAEDTSSVTPEEGQATSTPDAEGYSDRVILETEPSVAGVSSGTAVRREWLKERIDDPSFRRAAVGIFALILIAFCGLFIILSNGVEHGHKREMGRTVLNGSEPEPQSFVPTGAPSFTAFEQEANKRQTEGNGGMWLAASELHGFSSVEAAQYAIHQHVLVEAVKGLDYYVRKVGPEGMWVTNTGIGTTGYSTATNFLKPGTLYLTWDQSLESVPADRRGQEAVKSNCGNPIRRSKPPEVKGPNPFPNWIRDHQASVPVPGPTTGDPGMAEEVVEEQNEAPIGGLDSTPHGTPGDGAGGITPPGETQQPDGSMVPNPPPPNEPPGPPPPASEVPSGTVMPKPN